MVNKTVVLLSGGLDSTVNLYEAINNTQVQLALTFNYGQRAAKKEIAMASKTAQHLNVAHKVIELPWFAEFTNTSLVNKQKQVPTHKDVSIDDMDMSSESAKAVWVPNRNGIFLNIAAGFAEGLGAKYIIPGFNLEEAATFPDNSSEFMQAMNTSLSFSTSNAIQVKCYTDQLSKPEIVSRGRDLQVEFDYIWPCYFDGESLCGQCESCQRYFRAVNA